MKKLLSKESKVTCPHCHEKLPYGTLTTYFIHGAVYTVHCPHCNTLIKPSKDPISFIQASISTSLGVFLSGVLYSKYIDKNYWHTMVFSLIIGLLYMLFVAIYTIIKIKFVEY